jgi:4-hydroxy-tetrahydrodipicolinate reductase
MQKLAILGCSGKTGSKILEAALLSDKFDVVGGFVSNKSKFLNLDLAHIVGKTQQTHILATDNISRAIENAEIIIDFSSKSATQDLISKPHLMQNKKLIIGVTGFDEDFHKTLAYTAKQNIIFHSSNMSIGVALICDFLKKHKKILSEEYEILISDIHHKNKKDAPSGTALMLKSNLDNEVQISSSRIGDVNGLHEIYLFGRYENIFIKHEALNRELFANGTLKIASWISNIYKNGLYDMSDFLEDYSRK